jgi:hypothetical protein
MEDRRLLSTFTVTTDADSGPGSLRQAILESNAGTGGGNTIEFDIPGGRAHTIALLQPLPAITNSVLIDGGSQPGSSGSPSIELTGDPAGTGDGLITAGSDVTVRGLVLHSFAVGSSGAGGVLTIQSVAFPQGGSTTDSYRVDTSAGEHLVAMVHSPAGLTTRLVLRDTQGNVLMQSDGQSEANPDSLINLAVPPGAVSFEVQNLGGSGSYTLTATLTPAATPFQPIPVTSSPSAIMTGDFNGDGFSDIATANLWSGDVSVILSNGDGSFQPPRIYAVGAHPVSIEAADFTGDGKLDLAVAISDQNEVLILPGNGDGTFQPPRITSLAAGTLAAGDFNRDGVADLAVALGGSNQVSVWLGNGDGTFRADGTYPVGTSPRQIVTGDFNGDGIADLATANPWSQDVSVLLGNSDGSFQPELRYKVASPPASVVAADFNGDGFTDLATANYFSNNVSVLLSNGDGTFQPQRSYTVGSGPAFLVAGEFTGDGKTELVTGNAGSTDVSMLLGNGDGTFQTQRTYAVGLWPYSVVTGDFNGDSRTDLASGNFGSSDVSALLGNGDGTFQTQVSYVVGSQPLSEVTADFNGDGYSDLATANIYSNDVSILVGNGDGSFQTQRRYAVGTFPTSLVSGDFNGDGRIDLACANSSSNDVSVLLGNGDGSFQTQVTYAVGTRPYSLVTGDFNGDGILDLAAANNSSNDVSILLGKGDGTFQTEVRYAVGTSPVSITADDFNGDGHLDLAIADSVSGDFFDAANANSGPGDVSVLLGNGNGTFQPRQTYLVGSQPYNLEAGDFNGDGWIDIACANFESDDVSILLGKGDGTFQPQRTYAVGSHPIGVHTGDFNGDGTLDLAVANDGSHDVSILLGDGDGTFRPQRQYEVGSTPTTLGTGDFNGDGRTDLAIGRSGSDVSVWQGTGDGTFVNPDLLVTTPHATPLVGDFNGDGTEDVLVVDAAGDILYRQGQRGRPGSFEPPVKINPGYPSRDIAWVPNTLKGTLLASIDARDAAVSLYTWRDGGFARIGSLPTGPLPAQIISADLDRDGWDELVVRNAGDGTLTVFVNNGLGSFRTGFAAPFVRPATLPVGLGVSDVATVDPTGRHLPDLLITNKLTAQVSVLHNWGDGSFAAPAPYRAGTGLSAIQDSTDLPAVTSLEATAGVAAGSLMAGGVPSLVTVNPGSNTMAVLAGLGRGRYANAVAIRTQSPAQVVRTGDFNHDGVADLAVLTSKGVSIYLGNGSGGVLPPVTVDAGPDPSGLTVADLNHDGNPDLVVGNAYGDVLALLGQRGGTFRPYHKTDQAITLAVADLTGKGSRDIIYADQGLDRVAVAYSGAETAILGDRSSGLLAPSAVALADMNGDGIPDLIVANSGSNNVLVYLGLGDGQFGSAVNGGHGFFTGTNPVAIAVANLNGRPDLLVANAGSNDVSVLLGRGSGSSWTLVPGPRIKTQAGPDAVAAGRMTADSPIDLFVANRQSNTVQRFPGVGNGFFDDRNPTVYPVGQAPTALFLGNFGGSGLGVATLNAGSNDGTLITGLPSENADTRTFATGGDRPTAGFAGDFTRDGFTDLVVGNNGDGRLALLLGGPNGLSLSQTLTSAEAPNPTGLSFAGVSNGILSFYVSTAGHEAAVNLAFTLSGAPGAEPGAGSVVVTPATGLPLAAVLAQATSGSVQHVTQLVSLSGTTLELAGTVLTASVVTGSFEGGSSALAPASVSSSGLGQGQGPAQDRARGGSEAELPGEPERGQREALGDAAQLPPWERLSMGLDRAWEQARAAILDTESQWPTAADPTSSAPPAVSRRPTPPAPSPAPPRTKANASAPPQAMPDPSASDRVAPVGSNTHWLPQRTSHLIDAALDELAAEGEWDKRLAQQRPERSGDLTQTGHPGSARVLIAALVSATVVGTFGTRGASCFPRRRSALVALG